MCRFIRVVWNIRRLRSKVDSVRQAATKALVNLDAVEPLIRKLGDWRDHVRRTVAEILANLGQPKWRDLVRGDREGFPRLGSNRDARAVDPLLQCLQNQGSSKARTKNPYIDMRRSAAQGISFLAATQPAALIPHWDRIGELIRKPEEHSHNDGYGCSFHTDSHTDSGIGLPWPEKPPIGEDDTPQATNAQNLDFWNHAAERRPIHTRSSTSTQRDLDAPPPDSSGLRARAVQLWCAGQQYLGMGDPKGETRRA